MHNDLLNKKIQIQLNDFIHNNSAPFNIFNSKGKLVCKKGERLNAKILNVLSSSAIYRLATPNDFKEMNSQLSRISIEASETLLNIIKSFFDVTIDNNRPSIKVVFQARDLIFDLVKTHYHQTKHIEELRLYYSQYYFSHIINVSILSTVLGLKLGYEDSQLKDLTLGALLHDVGMTKMPKEILDKPWELTKSEYDLIKLHPRIGYKMLKDEYNMEDKIAIVALEHHERYNGSGYPRGLEENKINMNAQIVSVADVYDAAASNKVYAERKEPQNIVKELLKLSKSFHPKILQTMIYLIEYKTE